MMKLNMNAFISFYLYIELIYFRLTLDRLKGTVNIVVLKNKYEASQNKLF